MGTKQPHHPSDIAPPHRRHPRCLSIIELASKGNPKDAAINVVLTASAVAVEGFCMNRSSVPVNALDHFTNQSTDRSPLLWLHPTTMLVLMVWSSTWLVSSPNHFGSGYFQGSAEAPLEASSACPGIYGRGAYPGYAGKPTCGPSYNDHGEHGRKYMLPALYDPTTSSFSTLV
ncbi:hypothetical protein V6N13_054114 [Hibiscus sabdariffa]